jgi:Domain of unknown function (DUF1648)
MTGGPDPRILDALTATREEGRTVMRGPLRRYVALATALLAAAVIASVVGYLHLPSDARVAVHFTGGRPDRYAGRTFAVLAMPVTLVGFLAIGAGCVWSAARKRADAMRVAVLFLATGLMLLGVHAAILGGGPD